MKIAVLDDYQDVVRKLKAFEQIAGHKVVVFDDTTTDSGTLIRRLADVDVVVLNAQRTILPGAVISASDLKLIVQTGRNTSHIDVDTASSKGVAVSVVGAGSPSAVAELNWALILASRRNIPDEVAALRQGRWQTTIGFGLAGKTLGIYALGRIGGLVASIGRAFGMRIVCWGREGSLARAKQAGYEVSASREELFANADVLSLHLPLNDETRSSITAADLARMRPDALLVNTSRAKLIAPGALAAAMDKGRPGFAALDVFEEEPIVGDHPLVGMSNVIATPHIGYVVRDVYEDLYGKAFEEVLAFHEGRPMNAINRDALDRRAERGEV